MDRGCKRSADFKAGKTQQVLFDQSYNTGAIDMKNDGLFLMKNHLLRWWGWLSLLNWIETVTLSLLLKLPLRAFISSKKFLSIGVALYLYKSTMCLCMEYWCHVSAGAPSCYLELLDKLHKWICRSVCPSLATSLESLTHCQIVASLSLFYWYYFGRCSSELAQLAPFPFLRGMSTRYSDRSHDFSVTIPITRMSMSTVSFVAQLDSGILCL